MNRWQAVGKQLFLVDDDTIHWNVSGEISGNDLLTIFEEGFRVQTAHGYTLFCINIVGDWSFPSETRKALAQFHSTHKAVGASAIVGLSAKAVMFIELVLRGVTKVSGHRPTTRFFNTVLDATVWLREERRRLHFMLHTQRT